MLLSAEQQLSTPGDLLRAVTWIHLLDLQAAAPVQEGLSQLQTNKTGYLKAHTLLLTQVNKVTQTRKLKLLKQVK